MQLHKPKLITVTDSVALSLEILLNLICKNASKNITTLKKKHNRLIRLTAAPEIEEIYAKMCSAYEFITIMKSKFLGLITSENSNVVYIHQDARFNGFLFLFKDHYLIHIKARIESTNSNHRK